MVKHRSVLQLSEEVSNGLKYLRYVDPEIIGIIGKLMHLEFVERTHFSCAGVGLRAPFGSKEAGVKKFHEAGSKGNSAYIIIEYKTGMKEKWRHLHHFMSQMFTENSKTHHGKNCYSYRFISEDESVIRFKWKMVESTLDRFLLNIGPVYAKQVRIK